ncbi:hypothetical protein [Octadecabacter sp. R77987]
MTLFQDVTFFQVTLSLLAVGVLEQLAQFLPKDIVGPNGWLLRNDAQG